MKSFPKLAWLLTLAVCAAPSARACDVDNPPVLAGLRLAGWLALPDVSTDYQLKLSTPAGWLTGIPLLVRVEVQQADGARARDLWDADVSLVSASAGVSLSTNKLTLRNGFGTALVTATGAGDFTMQASLGMLTVNRVVTSLAGAPVTTVSGTLPGTSTTWSNVVKIPANLTVPVGHTLTILPGTYVLLAGVASGTAGTTITVNGTVNSLGTEDQPITITAMNPAQPWGGFNHNAAASSFYRHTLIHRACNTPAQGDHTGTGPVFWSRGSTISFDNCSISDNTGKIAASFSGTQLNFTNCYLGRSIMGPEIQDTGLQCINTWITEMRSPNDSDGIYLHTQQAGQQVHFQGCVIGFVDDDGIDTLGATATIEDSILRNCCDKGMSFYNGNLDVKHCLIVGDTHGISTKNNSGATVRVRVDRTTIAVATNGIAIIVKNTGDTPNIEYFVTNSIVRGAVPLFSSVAASNVNLHLTYCNVGQSWPGTGNITSNPAFVDAVGGDYHLMETSPCIDAGDPASAHDADGTRADQGFFAVYQAPQILTQPASQSVVAGTNVTFSVVASGRAPLGYQWRLNGGNLDGASDAFLILSNVSPAQAGEYTVVVSNSVGSVTSVVAVLTVVVPPTVTQQPQPQMVPAGQTATFSVMADGDQPLSYQWQSDAGAGFSDIVDATNATLVLPAVTINDYGVLFRVRISNAVGTVTSDPAKLIVILIAPLKITEQPHSQCVLAGSEATFTVKATGGLPPLTYQWSFNGTDITDATNALLTVANVQAADAGDYVVVVRDHAGSMTTSQAAPLALLVTPALSGFQNLPNGDFQFNLTGNPNKTYEVQASTNLSDWDTLATLVLTASPMTWTDTNTLAFPYRFYRVRLVP